MLHHSRTAFRWRQATAVVLLAGLATAAAAADNPPGALSVLIDRLATQGVLTPADAGDLRLLAEAEAAEAAATAAALKAAEARATAAEARLRAYAALAARAPGAAPLAAAVAAPAAPRPAAPVAAPRPRVEAPAPELPAAPAAPEEPAPAVERAAPAYAGNNPVVAEALARHRAAELARSEAPAAPATATRRRAAAAPAVEPEPAPEPAEETAAPEAETEAEAEPMADAATPDDTVRVTYVPEVVRRQLREQVKQDVLAEAREEGWATPRAVPDWVGRFRFFGDLRTRYEGIRFPTGNDNTGAFPNFNAINTGAPFDVTGTVFSPQLNVDQDRQRFRLRARLGTALDLGEGFTGGLRIATGDSNSPVSQNQTIGGAGLAQGGNFAKYALWLDRAFLRYELGGLPDQDLMFTVGRQDNPYQTTSMLWADDLGFDGLTAQGRLGLGESITGFLTAGAYPVFNTDLNFATNRPAKFKSSDKWLYAAQLGANFDLGTHAVLKLAVAYYPFSGVEGRLSTPFVAFTAADSGDTDSTRPAFAQKGNSYMMLRDLTPVAGDAASGGNQNGTINQYQYFGLASKFRPLVGDLRFEFNQFEPFQVALTAQYVKNLAFDPVASAAVAINNRGAATTADPQGVFLGQDTAWNAFLTVGDVALQKRWDWSVSLGYRSVGSDALIDGFADSDFGGGGTNVKGVTVMGSLALSSRVWLALRWMSAREAVGPQFKSDIFQLDVNGKF